MQIEGRTARIVIFVIMEVTNGLIKWVFSLSQKKNREKEGCFVAEGTKCVVDTLDHFNCKYLFATKKWIEDYRGQINTEIVEVSRLQMDRMSMLKTASSVLAVYEIPKKQDAVDLKKQLVLVLDGVQDPGNLGTIMRVADWFGVRHIFCSNDTVDVYNPKTVQATMGAISRVAVRYCDLPDLFVQYPELPVFGTFLDGDNIYSQKLTQSGFVVMGNEGNGISRDVEECVTQKLLIPSYPVGVPTSESLNVGTATAIVLSEFRRSKF